MSHIRVLAVALLCAAFMVASPMVAQQSPAANPADVIPDKMPADIPYGAPITLERAQAGINAAMAEAKKRDWKMNITVVDSGNNLVAFARMDGAQLGSIAISQHKAHWAVLSRRETKMYENAVASTNTVLTLDGIIASRGGIPLIEGGKIIGAIGCSGGVGSQDEATCKAGVAAIIK